MWKIFIHNLDSFHSVIMSSSVKMAILDNLGLQGEMWLICCIKIIFLHRRVGTFNFGKMGWWESLGDLLSSGPVKSVAERQGKMLSLSGLHPCPYHQRTRCNGKIWEFRHQNLGFKVCASLLNNFMILV